MASWLSSLARRSWSRLGRLELLGRDVHLALGHGDELLFRPPAGQGEAGFGGRDPGVGLVHLDAELVGVDPAEEVPLGDLLAFADQDLVDDPLGLGPDLDLDRLDDPRNLENGCVRGLVPAGSSDDRDDQKEPRRPGCPHMLGHGFS